MNILSSGSLTVGSEFNLTCNISASSPFNVTEITWTGPQGAVQSSDRVNITLNMTNSYSLNTTVAFRPLTLFDAGVWTCNATLNLTYPVVNWTNSTSTFVSVSSKCFRSAVWLCKMHDNDALLIAVLLAFLMSYILKFF